MRRIGSRRRGEGWLSGGGRRPSLFDGAECPRGSHARPAPDGAPVQMPYPWEGGRGYWRWSNHKARLVWWPVPRSHRWVKCGFDRQHHCDAPIVRRIKPPQYRCRCRVRWRGPRFSLPNGQNAGAGSHIEHAPHGLAFRQFLDRQKAPLGGLVAAWAECRTCLDH